MGCWGTRCSSLTSVLLNTAATISTLLYASMITMQKYKPEQTNRSLARGKGGGGGVMLPCMSSRGDCPNHARHARDRNSFEKFYLRDLGDKGNHWVT